jgi:hypothetical protein
VTSSTSRWPVPCDLLLPLSVAIYRCVDDGSADSAWVDLERLPSVDAYPLRHECLRTQEMACRSDDTHLAVFPLATDHHGVVGVLEIETEAALATGQPRLVRSVLRIYRNFQGLLDYSERDMLTGLLNRKTFDETCSDGGTARRLGSTLRFQARGRRTAPKRSIVLARASSWRTTGAG